MERRAFERSSVEMNGELSWTTKLRFGRKARQRAFIRTSNLSLDGAKLSIPGEYPFAVGAIARIQLGIQYCELRILDVRHAQNTTTLRVTFVSPSRNFVGMLEEQLAINTKARERIEGKWV